MGQTKNQNAGKRDEKNSHPPMQRWLWKGIVGALSATTITIAIGKHGAAQPERKTDKKSEVGYVAPDAPQYTDDAVVERALNGYTLGPLPKDYIETLNLLKPSPKYKEVVEWYKQAVLRRGHEGEIAARI